MLLNPESEHTQVRNFLELTTDAVILADSEGRLIEFNSNAKKLELISENDSLLEKDWYPALRFLPPGEAVHIFLRTSVIKRLLEVKVAAICLADFPEKIITAYVFQDRTPYRKLEVTIKRLKSLNHRDRNRIRDLEIRDPLTGLFNRNYMMETFAAELSKASRNDHSIGIILMDIDRLKGINDAFGNSKGDMLIAEIGKILLENSRKSDIACRLGGEEFLLLLPGAKREIVLERAEKIRELFSKFFMEDSTGPINGTLSAGVAMFPADGTSEDDLIYAANSALYVAKRSGRNRVVSTGTKD
ncbi:diguanylate cyclase (GGDEF) domain protein [Leptospira fainei serovar Hurstbridge str. BUT 6]|uniref:diguanylate cyclase n=1 Tax=Leptospira fainei serovar Hurstbridge str. BUT 6 TaxID=1193011 RepID=S3UWX8_9LEPT|nr:GGDEF domain-containing protein [Leptospira fainei]EPG73778.1 diguanylate cyclase (GGDEF) domain protein [Leptospira fainei serovar Hurstbridge str. BUT 6]